MNIREINFNINKLATPFYQAILIIITSVILIFITYKPLRVFNNLDPAPQIYSLENKQVATPIKTGFYVRNFLEFDILKNEFIVEGVLWFIHDTTKISQKLIDNFSFTKGELLKGEIIGKQAPEIIKLSLNNQLVKYNIRVKFSSNINYKLFPLDSHKLYIVLNNKYISADKAYFDTDSSRFVSADTLYAFGWNRIGQDVQTGFSLVNLDKNDNQMQFKYPRAIFSFDFIISNFKNMSLVFLPLFVVFFLSMLLFSLDPKKYRESIITISAATMPAIIAYRFVIETISPKASYFMLSDHIFTLFLILSFLIFIATVYFEEFIISPGFLIIFFHATLIISWTYLLYVWGA